MKVSTGPWDMEKLTKLPAVQWGTATHDPEYSLTSLYYEGEPYRGRTTRVFAYYAAPKECEGPLPAVVLVHGGAGKAFPEWAGQWAKRGYVAIAMDLFGNGPDGERLEDGGPEQTEESLFFGLSTDTLTEAWSYHAVADVIRAITLMASMPEIDAAKIGLMGISWGGYVTEIVTGLDSRPAYAMAVYAAGYFREGSCWMETMSRMDGAQLRLWEETFDVGRYIGQSKTPMLWATGTNDTCFDLDCWRKTYTAAKGPRTLRLMKDWEHNYEVPWNTNEFFVYADSQVRGGRPLPTVRDISEDGDGWVWAEYGASDRVRSAELLYTADTGRSPDRVWVAGSAVVDSGARRVAGRIPNVAAQFYFSLEDEEGNRISSEVVDRSEATVR